MRGYSIVALFMIVLLFSMMGCVTSTGAEESDDTGQAQSGSAECKWYEEPYTVAGTEAFTSCMVEASGSVWLIDGRAGTCVSSDRNENAFAEEQLAEAYRVASYLGYDAFAQSTPMGLSDAYASVLDWSVSGPQSSAPLRVSGARGYHFKSFCKNEVSLTVECSGDEDAGKVKFGRVECTNGCNPAGTACR
jgi:hypothetical protein